MFCRGQGLIAIASSSTKEHLGGSRATDLLWKVAFLYSGVHSEGNVVEEITGHSVVHQSELEGDEEIHSIYTEHATKEVLPDRDTKSEAL